MIKFLNICDEIKYRIKTIIIKQRKIIDNLNINILTFDFPIEETKKDYNFQTNFFLNLQMNKEDISYHVSLFKKRWFNKHYFSKFEFLHDGTLRVKIGNKLILKYAHLPKIQKVQSFFNISYYFHKTLNESFNINELRSFFHASTISKMLDSVNIPFNFEIINESKTPNVLLKTLCKDFEIIPDLFFDEHLLTTFNFFEIIEKKLAPHIIERGDEMYINKFSLLTEEDILIKKDNKYTDFFIFLTRHFVILSRGYTHQIVFNFEISEEFITNVKKILELLKCDVKFFFFTFYNKNLTINYNQIANDYSKATIKFILNFFNQKTFCDLNNKNYLTSFNIEKLNYMFFCNVLKSVKEKCKAIALNKKNNKLDYHFIFTSYNYDLLLTLAKFSWVQTNVFSSCCVKPLAEYSLVLAEQVSSLLKNMTLNDENILLYSCFIMEKISNLLFL